MCFNTFSVFHTSVVCVLVNKYRLFGYQSHSMYSWHNTYTCVAFYNAYYKFITTRDCIWRIYKNDRLKRGISAMGETAKWSGLRPPMWIIVAFSIAFKNYSRIKKINKSRKTFWTTRLYWLIPRNGLPISDCRGNDFLP